MPLLIPLDSPLSWVSNRIDILQIRWRFAPFGVKPLFYFAFGVCLYLFCVIIISSILHNVKRFLRLFRLHIAQQKVVHFGDLALFSKCGIWYNKSVGACEVSGPCADAARVRHGYGAQLAGPDITDDTSELQWSVIFTVRCDKVNCLLGQEKVPWGTTSAHRLYIHLHPCTRRDAQCAPKASLNGWHKQSISADCWKLAENKVNPYIFFTLHSNKITNY